MDHIFAQSNSAGVGANGNTELCCHKENTKNFAHAGKTTRVDLDDVKGLRLEKLLEQYAIVRVFASRDANAQGFQSFANGRVAENVIWRCRLFNEPRLDGCQVANPFNGLRHVPHLETCSAGAADV